MLIHCWWSVNCTGLGGGEQLCCIYGEPKNTQSWGFMLRKTWTPEKFMNTKIFVAVFFRTVFLYLQVFRASFLVVAFWQESRPYWWAWLRRGRCQVSHKPRAYHLSSQPRLQRYLTPRPSGVSCFSAAVFSYLSALNLANHFLEMWIFWQPGNLNLALQRASITGSLFCSLVRIDTCLELRLRTACQSWKSTGKRCLQGPLGQPVQTVNWLLTPPGRLLCAATAPWDPTGKSTQSAWLAAKGLLFLFMCFIHQWPTTVSGSSLAVPLLLILAGYGPSFGQGCISAAE